MAQPFEPVTGLCSNSLMREFQTCQHVPATGNMQLTARENVTSAFMVDRNRRLRFRHTRIGPAIALNPRKYHAPISGAKRALHPVQQTCKKHLLSDRTRSDLHC